MKRKLILGKIGSVLVDRRLWVYLFTLAAVILGMPKLGENAENLGTDVASAIVLITQGVTILVGALSLIFSWERRPPSGLNYKEVLDNLNKFAELLKEAGVKLD